MNKISSELINSKNFSFTDKSEQTSALSKEGPSFLDHLKDSIEKVNDAQKISDQMATDLATGKTENIHETMIALSHAELSFNFMVQVRNKALEAYQDIMRMQV